MVKLKGKNQIVKFRRVAERIASRIENCEGVVGIVFMGGLVRGFADRFSDIDITVFINRRDDELRRRICDVGFAEARRFGVDLDLEVHFIGDFRRWRLNEADMWEFSKAKIVFDPKGEVKRMFSEKFRVSKSYWIKRIVVFGEYLKWYCCPPEEGVGSIAEC